MPRDLLRSQRLRMVHHQGDALRLGMNWTEEDLGKPQVLVDSADLDVLGRIGALLRY